jgi:hypothetical protein
MSQGRVATPPYQLEKEQQTLSLPAERVNAPPTGIYKLMHNQPASRRGSSGKLADKPGGKQQAPSLPAKRVDASSTENQIQGDGWPINQLTNQEDNGQ